MTSLSFTNTVSTSTKFPTHRPQVRNRNIPTDYCLVWFGDLALKWSTMAHSYHTDALVNRSSPILSERKKGMWRNKVTGCNNKGSHSRVSWWLPGWKTKDLSDPAGPDVAWFTPLVTQMCGAPACFYIFYNKRSSWRGSPSPADYRSGSFAGSN